jgi:hypothetical protein
MLVIQHDGAAPDPAGQHDATLPDPAGQHDGATAGRPGQAGQAGGAGLDAARARAERLGGRFIIQPREGGGTRLEWHVPLPKVPGTGDPPGQAGGGGAAGGGVGVVQQGAGGPAGAG